MKKPKPKTKRVSLENDPGKTELECELENPRLRKYCTYPFCGCERAKDDYPSNLVTQ